MKFINKLLLGMVLFNGVLVLTAPYFTLHGETLAESAMDVTTDETTANYGNVGNLGELLLDSFLNITTVAIVGVFVALSGPLSYIKGENKNVPLAIAIGLFVGLIVSLYNATISVFYNITPSNNAFISGLFALLSIGIGLIVVYDIIGMMAGQQVWD